MTVSDSPMKIYTQDIDPNIFLGDSSAISIERVEEIVSMRMIYKERDSDSKSLRDVLHETKDIIRRHDLVDVILYFCLVSYLLSSSYILLTSQYFLWEEHWLCQLHQPMKNDLD